ncbi:hypothetical protein KC851_03225 [Candidatus Kaiserbacteria bacterium]|nr:hypothetical protein [Candidatus Kaiserbacteria bacterium]
MDRFFNLLRKSLVATMVVMLTFVVSYVPHEHNKVPEAEAQWAVIDAAHIKVSAENTFANLARWALDIYQDWKESIGDGLAWYMAKAIISNMIRELTMWIQSGFQGRPMFIENLGDFMLETSDRAIGEFIDGELGDLGSFICSPFKLDILAAIASDYSASRDKPPSCTLTGVIDNLAGFTEGTQGSFSKGGWDDWMDITSNPGQYTAYGSYLEAESEAGVRIANARNQVLWEADMGNGFFSAKECKEAEGAGGYTQTICNIVTPGKLIEDALSEGLDSDRESLVAADEINELVGALIDQAANRVFTGARGVLGM